MKHILLALVIIALNATTSSSARADTDIERAARAVLYAAENYSIILNSLEDLSQTDFTDPEQTINRDLGVCYGVGATEGYILLLSRPLTALEVAQNHDLEEVLRLDRAMGALSVSRGGILRFCSKSSEEYRNIKTFRQLLGIHSSHLQALVEIVEKHAPKRK